MISNLQIFKSLLSYFMSMTLVVPKSRVILLETRIKMGVKEVTNKSTQYQGCRKQAPAAKEEEW